MNFNRQCDPRWGSLTYDGKNTFCKYGCMVCSLSMLCDKTPPETAKILKDNGLFTNGYLNDSVKAAQVLGLEYNGKSTIKPAYDTIAETNYFDNKSTTAVEQHFYIVKEDGSQVDPLGKSILYPVVSYRLFKRKDDMAWYQIGDKIFNNDAYVTDPNTVPWPEVKKLNPQGLEFSQTGTLADLTSQVNLLSEQVKTLQKELNTFKDLATGLTNEKSVLESKLEACMAKPAEVKEVEKIVYKDKIVEKEYTLKELIGLLLKKITHL